MGVEIHLEILINIKSNSRNLELLTRLTKQFKLKLAQSGENINQGSEIDFIIHDSNITISTPILHNSPSDHKLLQWRITIPTPESRNNVVIIGA